MTTAFILLTLPNIFPPMRHLPVPFWVTMSVIGRDILIVVVAGAIHIVTGFRGFRPSTLGKLSTLVQVSAVGLILTAPLFPNTDGFYLPAVYTSVTLLAFVSGVHYIFFVARLMNESTNDAK
jgi:cardiolipin synthase